jgi:hypothetical protein
LSTVHTGNSLARARRQAGSEQGKKAAAARRRLQKAGARASRSFSPGRHQSAPQHARVGKKALGSVSVARSLFFFRNSPGSARRVRPGRWSKPQPDGTRTTNRTATTAWHMRCRPAFERHAEYWRAGPRVRTAC